MLKERLTEMRKRFVVSMFALLLVAIVLVAVTPVFAARLDGADHGGRPLAAALSGDAVVPDPPGGDPDGTGSAALTLNQGQGEVCFSIEVDNVAAPGPAHIHEGAAGVAGGVVVALTSSVTDNPSGCVTADAQLIKSIRQNPADFYVQVHNAEFPAGVVRGQLSK